MISFFRPRASSRLICTVVVLVALPCFISEAHESEAHDEPTPLHTEMETMSRMLRKLNRQIDEPEKLESSRALLATMKASAEKARALEPHFEEKITEAAREERIKRYHHLIDGVLATIRETEAALDKSEFDGAKKKISALLEQRKKAHEEFQVEED